MTSPGRSPSSRLVLFVIEVLLCQKQTSDCHFKGSQVLEILMKSKGKVLLKFSGKAPKENAVVVDRSTLSHPNELLPFFF
mmetsp:Transcript_10383/g.18167  ORF Transcript_10383/g.18167 Transcript_10383/m.18167 type:complete len:80 (-) Transcript_10383:178-417(-)